MDPLEFNWVQLWFQKLNALILKTGLFVSSCNGGRAEGGGWKGERRLPEAPSLSLKLLMIRPPKLHRIKYQSFPTTRQNVIDIMCWSCHNWCYDDVFFYQKRILNLPQSWHFTLLQTRTNRSNSDRKNDLAAYNLGFLGTKKNPEGWIPMAVNTVKTWTQHLAFAFGHFKFMCSL